MQQQGEVPKLVIAVCQAEKQWDQCSPNPEDL